MSRGHGEKRVATCGVVWCAMGDRNTHARVTWGAVLVGSGGVGWGEGWETAG